MRDNPNNNSMNNQNKSSYPGVSTKIPSIAKISSQIKKKLLKVVIVKSVSKQQTEGSFSSQLILLS